MPRLFITGSADGLGRATAQNLLDGGHEVVVHARSEERLGAIDDLVGRGAVPVVGDLADLDQTRDVAEQVNRIGRMDAVIHNAGVSTGRPSCRSTSSPRTCSRSSSTGLSGWCTSAATCTPAGGPT